MSVVAQIHCGASVQRDHGYRLEFRRRTAHILYTHVHHLRFCRIHGNKAQYIGAQFHITMLNTEAALMPKKPAPDFDLFRSFSFRLLPYRGARHGAQRTVGESQPEIPFALIVVKIERARRRQYESVLVEHQISAAVGRYRTHQPRFIAKRKIQVRIRACIFQFKGSSVIKKCISHLKSPKSCL